MKHMKEYEVPAEIKKRVDFTSCDLCKKKIDESDENQVHFATYDICGRCFEERLLPHISNGRVDKG